MGLADTTAVKTGFKVGDKVVHPAYGVGEITAVENREIKTVKKDWYVIELLDNRAMKLYIATDTSDRVGLRSLVSKKEAERVVAVLRETKLAVTSQPWNRRQREYHEMLNSGSLVEVAKVLRDITRLKSEKDLSLGERQLLEQARGKLITELALVKRCKEDRVEAEIQGIFAS